MLSGVCFEWSRSGHDQVNGKMIWMHPLQKMRAL